MTPRGTPRALLAVLALGLALRCLGLCWGLPGRVAPEEPPFHPDEHEFFVGAELLYGEPVGVTFNKGGAFYTRLGWLARAAVRAARGPELPLEREWAESIVLLRLLNAGLALAAALLLARLGRDLDGPATGLSAAALWLCFPGPVLDSHYARPDVLVACLSTAALAAAWRAARGGGGAPLALGGACAGLATATMLSGVVGFAPLAAAVLERELRGGPGGLRRCAASGARVALGALAGWGFGSVEALLHWDAFRQGLEIASSTHQGGGLSLPLGLLTTVSFYAFGSVATLAAWAGLLGLLRRPVRGGLVLLAHTAFAVALLARVGGDMMRHLEILAPPFAVLAAAGLSAAARALARAGFRPSRARAYAFGGAVAATAQLSLAYVWPLQFDVDPRYRAGRWLAERAEPGAMVGVTVSFYGDHTYALRFPGPHALRPVPLMVRRNFDASRYLDAGLDYVTTSDYARSHAGGPTAPAFFRELFDGERYRLAHAEGPRFRPLCVPDALGLRRPSDLLYVRSTFYVFEHR